MDMNLAILFFSEKNLDICKLLASRHKVLLAEEVPELWEKYPWTYGFACISVEQLFDLYHKGQIDKIIVMPSMRKTLNHFIKKMIIKGIREEDLWYLPVRQSRRFYTDVSELFESMCLFTKRRDLDYLGLHVQDGCNFKCKHCSMLEGAALSYKEISLDRTQQALSKLSALFEAVGLIQIMGGEPLLNHRLMDFLELVREYYPDSEIQILTNGSLVLEQTDIFFDKLKQTDISLVISRYPELDGKIEQINNFLRENDVAYCFTDKIVEFQKYYDLFQSSDIDADVTFDMCQSLQYCKNGLNVRENLIAPCCVPFALEHLTERFGMDISFCTVLDLEQDLSPKDIIRMLYMPHKMCRVCHLDNFAEWKQAEADDKLDIGNWSV